MLIGISYLVVMVLLGSPCLRLGFLFPRTVLFKSSESTFASVAYWVGQSFLIFVIAMVVSVGVIIIVPPFNFKMCASSLMMQVLVSSIAMFTNGVISTEYTLSDVDFAKENGVTYTFGQLGGNWGLFGIVSGLAGCFVSVYRLYLHHMH